MHYFDKEHKIDPETESCVSDVACEILQTDDVSNSEESSTCSQILEDIGLPSEQSSMTVDSTTTNEYKETTNQQPLPQRLSGNAYIKLNLHWDHLNNKEKTAGTHNHHTENTKICTHHTHQQFDRMNSVSSGYASYTNSPTTPTKLLEPGNQTMELEGSYRDISGQPSGSVKVGLNLEGSSYVTYGLCHINVHNTPVFFDFPQENEFT